MITITFFGSFQLYSVQVLERLVRQFSITSVITTPPKPAGRHLKLTPTEVARYATKNNIPVYPLNSLEKIPKEIEKPDFIVVAGYGKLIPSFWLEFPKTMAVNMHPSLLPNYRGAFPGEWAILNGEKETGVTLVKMSQEFDKGEILVQQAVPIKDWDTRESLYTKLYNLGATLLVENLPKIASGRIVSKPQPPGDYFYARHISREDGFIPWNEFERALEENSILLERKLRALSPWPGVWTTTPQGKRLKLISLSPQIVQLEGKNPVPFSQFSSAYLKEKGSS